MTIVMRQIFWGMLIASCCSNVSFCDSSCSSNVLEGVESFPVGAKNAVHHKLQVMMESPVVPVFNQPGATTTTRLSIFAPFTQSTTDKKVLSQSRAYRLRQLIRPRDGAVAIATMVKDESFKKQAFGFGLWREGEKVVGRGNIGSTSLSISSPPPPPKFLAPTVVPQPSSFLQSRFIVLFLVSGLSCMSTWACVMYGGMSPVRASSLHGLAASLFGLPSTLAAACLSGAFTGMSVYLNNSNNGLFALWKDAGFLSILAGLVYAWEATDPSLQRILAGKGGRLGSLSVVASLLFWILHRDAQSFTLLYDWVVREWGISRTLGIVVACGLFSGAQVYLVRLQRLATLLQQSIIPRTNKRKKKRHVVQRLRQDNNNANIMEDPAFTEPTTQVLRLQQELLLAQRWLMSLAKFFW